MGPSTSVPCPCLLSIERQLSNEPSTRVCYHDTILCFTRQVLRILMSFTFWLSPTFLNFDSLFLLCARYDCRTVYIVLGRVCKTGLHSLSACGLSDAAYLWHLIPASFSSAFIAVRRCGNDFREDPCLCLETIYERDDFFNAFVCPLMSHPPQGTCSYWRDDKVSFYTLRDG